MERSVIDSAVAKVARDYSSLIPEHMRGVIAYALAGGGKRLRGLLVSAAYHAAGGCQDVSQLAASIEIVHSYSLVHDDLPCMDDDDMRRGRLSTHKAFDAPSAAMAGAAMIPLAAAVARDAAVALELPPETGRMIVKVLMQGAGAGGMIGGQLLDLAGEGMTLSREDLDAIHSAKTGALIAASVQLGGIAAGATDSQVIAFGTFGRDIGLAFQIMDDVLDVTSSTARLGKTAGRDAELGKSTYPALLGVTGATQRAAALVEEGCSALRDQGLLTADLEHLAAFIVSRSH
jgi:geranylgeranyl pyrophosphate synthase